MVDGQIIIDLAIIYIYKQMRSENVQDFRSRLNLNNTR